MKTYYLNGDPAGTQITASVTNIVFGKNSEYPEIVNNHKGFLVDQEQDTDVYVYYIDNSQLTKAATGYTVYVLEWAFTRFSTRVTSSCA